MDDEQRPQSVRTAIGTMWIEDGVLWHRLETQDTITEEHALSVIDAIERLTEGNPMPAVVDMSHIGFATAAARSRFAGDVDGSQESATALVVRHGPGRLMASVYLKLAKPKRPTGVFVDARKAAEWAAGFKTN